jgi:non-ribosomal peptide synthetase component F
VERIAAASRDITIFNGYGPTETTTFATRHRIHPGPPTGDYVSIGTPMDHTRVYVLDDHELTWVADSSISRGLESLPIRIEGRRKR